MAFDPGGYFQNMSPWRSSLFGPVLFYDLVKTARNGRGVLLRCGYAAALLATLFFVGFSFFVSRAWPVDFRVLALLSLPPLAVGMFALVKRPAERQIAIRLVGAIIVSLALFYILADGYLAYLAAHL